MKKAVRVLVWLAIGFGISELIYHYGLELLKVPTSSMSPGIEAGDYVLVNKFIPGPRYKANDPNRYGRFALSRSLNYGDIVVFNFPEADTIVPNKPGESYYLLRRRDAGIDTLLTEEYWGELEALKVTQRPRMIKRVAALPGDNIQIIRGVLNVNGVEKDFRISSGDSVIILPPGVYDPYVFPGNYRHGWNVDNLGPFYLPRKGDVLVLDPKTFPLYERILKVFEASAIEQRGNRFYLDGKPVQQYVFKMNYYWVHGDNRNRSFDSRYWGPVPENHIVGVVKHR